MPLQIRITGKVERTEGTGELELEDMVAGHVARYVVLLLGHVGAVQAAPEPPTPLLVQGAVHLGLDNP